MNKVVFLFLFAVLASYAAPDNPCANAHQEATYSLQHTKKGLEAYNIALLKLSAKRAVESFQKLQESTQQCGCTEANNISYDALDNLSKAMEKTEYDASRFYVNRAHKNAKQIIELIEQCERDGSVSVYTSEQENLKQQEEALLAQQRMLEEKQQALQRQMEQQKLLQEEIRTKKQAELEQQVALKQTAEGSLRSFQQEIDKLLTGLECPSAYTAKQNFNRALEVLERESLETTKQHYADQARELAMQLINTLDDCED